MVTTCCVCKCNPKKPGERSFHTFPSAEQLKIAWLQALKMEKVAASARICSAHFREEDFTIPLMGTRRKLKDNAIPSLSETPIDEKHVPAVNVPEKSNDSDGILVKRSYLTAFAEMEDDGPPLKNYRCIADIEVDKVSKNPVEAKMCLEVALETIEEQRGKIKKLQTAKNKLKKSVADLRGLMMELKKNNFLSPEACEILNHKNGSPKEKARSLDESKELISQARKHLQQPQTDFDKIGLAWGVELQKMTQQQQMFAKQAINDILFVGQMGSLHRNSVQINSFETVTVKSEYILCD